MEKRNKGWRRFQQKRVLKARIQMFSGSNYAIYDEKSIHIDNPHWFEIARQRWAKKYKDSILLVVAGSAEAKSMTERNIGVQLNTLSKNV